MSGKIDGINSTTFPLAAGDSFSGNSFVSSVDFNEILITVETDTPYRLTVNFSSNGSDIGHQEEITENFAQLTALNGKTYSFKPFMQFYNVNLLNISGSAQTYLNISTLLKSEGVNVELNNLRNYQIFSSAGTTGSGSYLINGGNYPRQYTFYGSVSGATDLIVQISPDNSTFYDTQYIYTSSSAGSFGFTVPIAASYLRLNSSNSVNCDCWVNSN